MFERYMIASIFVLLSGSPVILAFDCGSNAQKLQVHLVPHTHDDVGWLKTVDEYYYGSNRTIQAAAVQYILDTVISTLSDNPARTFIYVEMAFFTRWWDEQNEQTKAKVRMLVHNKQLEFINGGWCMNDEAAAHYNAIIDQMTLGLQFISQTFGEEARPTVAWHIDPFGHSAEQASLFSLMSFDGFFFGRIDHEDKDKRMEEQRMEFAWQGSRNFKQASQIFTGVLYNLYQPPPGFCFDIYCDDDPIQDNPRLFDMNVKEKVDEFVDYACKMAGSYKTNNIMLTMGSDFQYENAQKWFKNMDKLIYYVNKDGRVNAFYSTPSRYLEALHQANASWEVKTDDFFPYSHCPHCYWTGYFTSRPTQKGYIRASNNLLQACKQLEVTRAPVAVGSSDSLRRAMAVNQHHDAVTGTEKQHVANDYAKRLSIGRVDCQNLMGSAISKTYTKGRQERDRVELNFQSCDYLNISLCPATQTSDSVVVNVYNPVARAVSSFVRVPVRSSKVLVYDWEGKPVTAQVAPVSSATAALQKLQGDTSGGFELVFQVSAPALGYNTYFVNYSTEGMDSQSSTVLSRPVNFGNEYFFLMNRFLVLQFYALTGHLVHMSRRDSNTSIAVEQQFLWYPGNPGDADSKQTSGAYVFRPLGSQAYPVCEGNVANYSIHKGPVYEEVRQTFGEFVSQVIRLYADAPYAEFEYTVGPIPVADAVGKEIISRFDTSIESGDLFYTDANGREMKQRKRNHRDTWTLNVTEPVSGNYYPVSSRIYIKDDHTQLTVMTDRSQGGSSINSGQLELMLHRRLLKDDFLGVGEPMNETGVDGNGLVTRGIQHVFISTPEESAGLHRVEGEHMLLSPQLSFAPNAISREDLLSFRYLPAYSALTRTLPDNVHLLTLEKLSGDQIIIRLEHLFENDEDPQMSTPVTVNLEGLFVDFKIVSLTETNLAANQKLSDKKMWEWNTDSPARERPSSSSASSYEIELKPMEIRTFVADIAYN